MEEIEARFARELKRLRDQRGFAQEELGLRAGLSTKYVGQVERRERGTTLRSASKIAAELGVPLETMISSTPIVSDGVGEYGARSALRRVIALLRRARDEDLAAFERMLTAGRPGKSNRRRRE